MFALWTEASTYGAASNADLLPLNDLSNRPEGGKILEKDSIGDH